jgi:hypothetical protein
MAQLVATLPLAPGYTAPCSTLSVAGNELPPSEVRVGERRPVTVPAGTFETRPVSLTSGVGSVTSYVTTSVPRRVVRIVGQNGQLELRVVK